MDKGSDLPALVRLWRLTDERTRLARGIAKQRVVAGYRGQPRANPLYAVLAGVDAEIRQLEDRFGLSPRSRLQLGVYVKESLEDLNAELEEKTDLAALYATQDKEKAHEP